MVFFNVIMIGSDDTALNKNSYFRRNIIYLKKYWQSILILAPSKSGKKGFHKIVDGVWYYYFPSFWRLFLFALGGNKKELDSKVIIAMDPFWYGLSSLFLKKRDQKVIIELHSQNLFNKIWIKYRKRHIFYHLLARIILRKAQHIRSVYYDEILFNKYKGKIKLVDALYIDTNLFKTSPKKKKEYDVIYVGRFHHQKNIYYLVEILKRLKHQGYSCLIIGGRGNIKYKRDLMRIGCKIIDWIPQKELAKYYQKSKVIVSVSPAEGGPRSVYEALCSGCLAAITPTGLAKQTILQHPYCGEFLTGENVEEDVKKIKKLIKEYPIRSEKCISKIRKEMGYSKHIKKYAKYVLEIMKGV